MTYDGADNCKNHTKVYNVVIFDKPLNQDNPPVFSERLPEGDILRRLYSFFTKTMKLSPFPQFAIKCIPDSNEPRVSKGSVWVEVVSAGRKFWIQANEIGELPPKETADI